MKIKDINETHNLYIIKVYNKESSLIKLGYSSKIKDRLLLYYHHNPLIEILNTFYREDGKEFELNLHRTIKSKVMNEWYVENQLETIINYIENKIEFTFDEYMNNVKFQTIVETIESFTETLTEEQSVYKEAAFTRFSFLKKAIEELGYNGIKEEHYVQTNIKRKLASIIDTNVKTKIYKLLIDFNEGVKLGNFISAKCLKDTFKIIYNDLQLNKTPKGSDINMFFNVKATKKKINNKTVEGYLLLNPKLIIK